MIFLYFGEASGALQLDALGHTPSAVVVPHRDALGLSRLRRRLGKKQVPIMVAASLEAIPSFLPLFPDLSPEQGHAVLLMWGACRLPSPASCQAFPGHVFRLHPSLLPALDGPDPMYWAIRRGHKTTGITLQLLSSPTDPSLQTSPQGLWQRSMVIEASDNARTLSRRVRRCMLGRAGTVFARIMATAAPSDPRERMQRTDDPDQRPAATMKPGGAPNETRPVVIDGGARRLGALDVGIVKASASEEPGALPSPASDAPRPGPDDLRIDWSLPAVEVMRAVRAASPTPGATASLGHRDIVVLEAEQACNTATYGKACSASSSLAEVDVCGPSSSPLADTALALTDATRPTSAAFAEAPSGETTLPVPVGGGWVDPQGALMVRVRDGVLHIKRWRARDRDVAETTRPLAQRDC